MQFCVEIYSKQAQRTWHEDEKRDHVSAEAQRQGSVTTNPHSPTLFHITALELTVHQTIHTSRLLLCQRTTTYQVFTGTSHTRSHMSLGGARRGGVVSAPVSRYTLSWRFTLRGGHSAYGTQVCLSAGSAHARYSPVISPSLPSLDPDAVQPIVCFIPHSCVRYRQLDLSSGFCIH